MIEKNLSKVIEKIQTVFKIFKNMFKSYVW